MDAKSVLIIRIMNVDNNDFNTNSNWTTQIMFAMGMTSKLNMTWHMSHNRRDSMQPSIALHPNNFHGKKNQFTAKILI